MATCLIDVRCLQDPAYAERGIGRHALNLLTHGRRLMPGVRLAGIVDGAMPALGGAAAAALDEVRGSAYTGALRGPCCHVQLSPMTHDPLFVARLLEHPAVPSATAVYDFIPMDEPGRYLPGPGPRLDYAVSLRWLARHELFMPISADAGARLHRLLVVPAHRVVVTGAPVGPGFAGLSQGVGRHVLVVAGADPRKNPECAVRAHARCRAMQDGRVPLVVTGAYDPAWLALQHETAAALGGDPALIEAAGHVNEAALRDLYAGALCLVAPSRAEGFSLPVVEAMAAGVPVLASDIPAHRELLTEGLFAPEDDGALAGLLDQVGGARWRTAALARQAAVWPRFTGEAVAARFWAGVGRLLPQESPGVVRGVRPRVAVLTPLPPDRTGVGTYSVPMCEALAERVELHVFTPTQGAVRPAGVAGVEPLSALPLLSCGFDRVVNVMGNSVFHLAILRLLLRHGGAVIQHDAKMIDLYAGHIGFEKTVAMSEAEMGRQLRPNEMWHWLAGDFAAEAMALAEIAAAAEPMMMHSRVGAAEVSRRYGRPVGHLPFCLQRPFDEAAGPGSRAAARERLGVRPGQVLLASFGFVHTTKAPLDCLWALDLLRGWGVDARLHFVGTPLMEPPQLLQLHGLVAALGLGPHIRLGDGFVDEASYRDHLLGADAAVQLRIGGVGAVSGALSDCIGAGLPTVASENLADALDAPGFVRRIPDMTSPVLLAEAVMEALGGGPTAEARRAYAAGHGFDTYAARLCEALGLA